MRQCLGHLNAALKFSYNFPCLMFFEKIIHEPEFLGEAFSMLAKCECQAHYQSGEPLKIIHRKPAQISK